MAQAAPRRDSDRPGRGQGRGERTRRQANGRPEPEAARVTPLESRPERQKRRQEPHQRAAKPGHAGRRRLPNLPVFLAGLGLGYGLSGPLPHLASALAALPHPGASLGTLIAPAGMGNRRIAVLGTDAVASNTDVMMTVQLQPGRTLLTQVPRDTYIETPRYGVMKANALYATGGPDLVKQELSRLLEAQVDHYLVVNLDAVQRLAEALGGVEVDVPKRMYYVDNSQGLYIDLYPGRQLLKGRELEGFLRYRHDELGDIGRMERQKLVLSEVFRKLANPATVTRLPELLRIAGRDIRTDLSPVDMGALLTAMGTTKLSSSRLPGAPYWFHDISYWMPDGQAQKASGLESEPTP